MKTNVLTRPVSPQAAGKYTTSRRLSVVAALVLLIAVAPLAAQELIVNNNPECEFSEEAVAYFSASGDVVVNDPNCVVSGGVVLTNIILDPDTVQAGEQVTVHWASGNADSCEPLDTSLPAWTNQSINTEGPKTFTVPINTSDGSYPIGIECQAGNNDTDTKTTTLIVEPEPIGPKPNKPTLAVNPATAAPGATVDISWNPNGTVTSCQAGGDLSAWSGTKSVSGGSQNVTIPTSASDGSSYEIWLRCKNGNSPWSDKAEKTISVEDENLPTECSDRPPLEYYDSKWKRSNGFRYDGAASNDYADVWGEFPGKKKHTVSLSKNQYVALKFNTGNYPNIDGNLKFIWEAGQIGPQFGTVLWTVSPCPGDFHKDAIESDTETSGMCYNESSIRIASSSTNPTYCLIKEANTDLYLNITTMPLFTPLPSQPANIPWGCTNSGVNECGALAEPVVSASWKP